LHFHLEWFGGPKMIFLVNCTVAWLYFAATMPMCRLFFAIALLLVLSSSSAQPTGRQLDATCVWDSLATMAVAEKDLGNYDRSLEALDAAREIAVRLKDADLTGRTHTLRGLVFLRGGRHQQAWLEWTGALDMALTHADMDGVAELHNYLGVACYHLKNSPKALEHFQTSLAIRKQIGTAYDLGVMLNNIASFEKDYGDPIKALEYFRTSLDHWKNAGYHSWLANTYSHIADVQLKLGRSDSAFWFYEKALSEVGEDEFSIRRRMRIYMRLGPWHLHHGDNREAVRLCSLGLEYFERSKAISEVMEGHQCLHLAYRNLGDHRSALFHYEKANALRDSLALDDQQREIALLQAGHEYERRQLADSLRMEEQRLRAEMTHASLLNAEKARRNLLLISTFSVLLLAGGLYYRLRFTRRSRELVRHERDRADQLLRNILPAQVAAELKTRGRSEPQEFKTATILFTDFHDFTRITEELSARELVSAIDECFTNFDRILKEHGVEKIKTVGDCYMACGGVPDPARGSPAEVVKAGLALQEFMVRHAADRQAAGLPFFTMRLGIHSGPVVAGIVGTDKFAYDIWGDAVNIAARMENTGKIGAVNISAHTYELVKNDPDLQFVERGMIQTKGKGRLKMYFAERLLLDPGSPPEHATAVARA
jgi:adenylate cyclase